MGDPEGWPQPSGLLPGALISNLDDERWALAENRTIELINRIKPNPSSEVRRRAVADHVEGLIRKCFDCQVFTFGSVPLKTYLPDGDIDLTTFSRDQHLHEAQANEVRAVLEAEERRKDAQFRVKEVQYIQAEVKIIKCLVENIVVDISFNQLGGLCTLCFLEEVDRLIGRNHLFKRSIILVKAWCYYESRILGAHHGLISTYALETLVLYIFHLFHESLHGPLAVLFRFLEFFSSFDWEKYCISLWGPIPLSALPDMLAEPPRKDGGKLLLNRAFLEGCSRAYAVLPNGHVPGNRAFGPKFLNVVDPLKTTNNLGRSVNKGNFYRIRSAFNMGAKTLVRILECPADNVVDELDKFFLNTWDRHGNGRRPDAPEHIERPLSFDATEEDRRVASSADLLQEMAGRSPNAAAAAATTGIASDSIHRFGSLAIREQVEAGVPSNPGNSAEENRRNKQDEVDRHSHKQREKGIIPEDRMLNGDRDWTDRPIATMSDVPPKVSQSMVWGNADVPPFYPRPTGNHSEEDEGWDVSSRGYGLNNMAPHHLPVPGPPPPPINIHPPSPVTEGQRLPSFGSHPPGFLPMRRGPVPPPFPQYSRPGVPPQRILDGENHHPDECRQEKDKDIEDHIEHGRVKLQVPAVVRGQPLSTRNGSRELSPDANLYEQNGTLHGDVDGWQRNERKSRPVGSAADEVPGEEKASDEFLESRRPPEGHAPPPGEPWPVMDPALLQYSQMLPQGPVPVVYTGLSPPLADSPSLAGHPDAASPVSSSFSPKRGSSAPQKSSVGILQPSSSDTGTVRKQRPVPVDTQATPSFYYSPFPFMVPYSPMPIYVIPQEGGGEGSSLNEDGQPQLIFGDSERLAATALSASAIERHNLDRSPDREEGETDLLTSDFAKHLRNLDFGRACQSPGPVFPHPGFLPFGKELQGHYIWEGPGRPVPANMKHGSRFPRNYQRNFAGPPGFSGEEGPKPRSGTGTYLPGTRPYRERHVKGQHDGYQEREFAERDGPPRYQRNLGRGQNNRSGQGGVKAGDKGWHAVPVTLTSGSQTGAVLTPSQLEAYSYMNANGSTPAGPLILMYPSNEAAGLEFGSLGAIPSPDHGAGRGMPRAHIAPAASGGHDRQLPSPMSEQRPAQRTYQMNEEDFPPLSFKARGASSSTSGSGTGKYQTYVASQS